MKFQRHLKQHQNGLSRHALIGSGSVSGYLQMQKMLVCLGDHVYCSLPGPSHAKSVPSPSRDRNTDHRLTVLTSFSIECICMIPMGVFII